MRDIKTLLTIMLDNIELIKTNDSGLCYLTVTLCCSEYNLISDDERQILLEYIQDNEPWHVKLFGLIYWYAKGRVRPRKRWLKKHIKRNTIR